MENLIPSLIVIGVTGLVVGLIFWLVHRNKITREQSMRDLASRNGWVYESVSEKFASGYRLRKGDWMIEALNETTDHSGDSSHSSSVVSVTRWFSDAAKLSDGIVLIGPRQPEVNLAGVGDFLMQAALRLMIGSDAEIAAGIKQEELGSLELMKRYMIWTNRVETAKRMVTAGLESVLINWPARLPVAVKYSPEGMEVKVPGFRLYKEAELYALVKLGNALLDSIS